MERRTGPFSIPVARSCAGSSARAWTRTAQPADQVAHYPFAFDAAGIATFRTLALVLSHPDALESVFAEMGQREGEGLGHLQLLDRRRIEPLGPARLDPTRPLPGLLDN